VDLEKHPQKPLAPADPGDIRASDADRDRITDILRDALAEGRLNAEEHSERVDAAYKAKTVGELRPLVRDLPAAGEPAGQPQAADDPHAYDPQDPSATADNMVAIFSSSTRKGRWRVGPRINAFALFGNIEIHLTEALFAQRKTVINATSIFGNVEVRVPENISLRGNGTGVFGNFEVVTLESPDPDAPLVIVNGNAVFGNIEAKPKRGKLIADLQDRIRKHLG
jgi:hypothetical protein